MQPTITITATGLQTRTIPLSADSTVELVEHDAGYNVYCALLVDGYHYDLCMWKHTVGRPELSQALDLALAAVKAAIAELQPTAYAAYPIDPDALKAVYEQAQRANPDTSKGWGKAIEAAYEYLMDLWFAGRPALFDGQVMLVESATEAGTIHRANGGCDCMYGLRAKERGEKAHCWHRASRQLVAKMLARAAYLAEAQTVADAISELDEAGASYEGSDVSIAKAALAQRIAAARAAVAAVERRERTYREAQELFA